MREHARVCVVMSVLNWQYRTVFDITALPARLVVPAGATRWRQNGAGGHGGRVTWVAAVCMCVRASMLQSRDVSVCAYCADNPLMYK